MAIFINIAGSDGTREFHVWFQTCRHYVLNIYLGYSLPIHKHISLSNWQDKLMCLCIGKLYPRYIFST